MLRELCLPPSHSMCPERLWQLVQASLASLGVATVNCLIFVLSPPASTCA